MLPQRGLGALGGRAGPACRAPHAIRTATGARRSPFLRRNHSPCIPSFLIINIFFPRKEGTRDCPSELRRGRHFPGKARRALAPGAPEREQEGSARPRVLLRAGPGFTAVRVLVPPPRVPRLTFPGAACPQAPGPSLRLAPPRPFHCQPEAAGALPGRPRRPPSGPQPPGRFPLGGRALPSSFCASNSTSPGALQSLQVQPCPGPAAGPRIPSPPSLLAQDAPSSSPAAGILPLL